MKKKPHDHKLCVYFLVWMPLAYSYLYSSFYDLCFVPVSFSKHFLFNFQQLCALIFFFFLLSPHSSFSSTNYSLNGQKYTCTYFCNDLMNIYEIIACSFPKYFSVKTWNELCKKKGARRLMLPLTKAFSLNKI